MSRFILASILFLSLQYSALSYAQETEEQEEDFTNQKINVDAIKEKYWARGQEEEMGVVQNRTYSKSGRVHLGLFAGTISGDPFLTLRGYGGLLGYNFSEYFAVNVFGFKYAVSKSDALETLESSSSGGTGRTANRNEPTSFYGAEAQWSLLYGKLSLLGWKIIYYDLMFLGGFGLTKNENKTPFTTSAGAGQQIYISRYVSLRFDYRAMMYREDVLNKASTVNANQVSSTRTNWSHTLFLGVNFLF